MRWKPVRLKLAASRTDFCELKVLMLRDKRATVRMLVVVFLFFADQHVGYLKIDFKPSIFLF